MLARAHQRATIYESDYYRMELDARGGVLFLVRTAQAFENLDAVRAEQVAILDRLQMLVRRHLGLLVDLRRGPSRNDPAFEQAIKEFRVALFALFRRVAVLVRTATGRMQLTRHMRSDGGEAHVFDDERRAFDYLHEAAQHLQAEEPGHGSEDSDEGAPPHDKKK
jgi:hypothetical protein